MSGAATQRRLQLAATALGLLACALAHAQNNGALAKKRMVCWTEDSGARACGDSIPPRYANREKHILDRTGRTVKIIPGSLTPEQRAAKEAQAQRVAAERQENERQAAYDRALLATYAKPQELAALRDDRLSTLDTSIQLTEAAAARDAVSVAELRARLPAAGSADKASRKLLDSVAMFETSLENNQRAVTDMRKQREEICETFARDIRRFQQLKAGSVGFESPCPPPGSFAPAGDRPPDLTAARHFFDRYVELERGFEAARFDLFAPGAIVTRVQTDSQGQPETLELTLEEHRAQTLRSLQQAQAKSDTYSYADVAVEAREDGNVRISATRISDLSRKSTPFELVIEPEADSWQVVELQLRAEP
ncbi:hypothetical protein [Panacagrimonas sp.]|uniref:hypothetical protein n=1 Tax=Panacagrimonas sp. TaxID=2480088 RepID=UPI003B525B4A